MEKQKHINIVGAGISGLTLAYYLSQKGFNIDLYEKSSRPGGLIQTFNTDKGMVETAANGCLDTPLVWELFQQVQIPYTEAKKSSRKRYLFTNGQPRRWPLNIFQTLIFFKGVLRTILKRGRPVEGQTVSVWAGQQFGRAAATKLISPALQGIYATDGNTLSAKLIFNRFFEKKKYKRGRNVISPVNGMGELINSLESFLKRNNVKFHYEKNISRNDLKGPVVFAGPLRNATQFCPEVFEDFQLHTRDISTVTIFTTEKTPALDGYGVLFPRNEGVQALGILVNGNIFENRVILGQSYKFIYGDKCDLTDESLLNLISQDFKKAFNKKLLISDFKITHWKESLPVYDRKLEEFLKYYCPKNKDFYLTGNYLGKLGLTGILEYNFELAEKISMEHNNVLQ
jgi:oxygen-dependent protoporphyrinogen oxidase